MAEITSPIWENTPSTNTPINDINLNKITTDLNSINNELINGWISAEGTYTYSSVDGQTGVITTSADTRSYISEGYKIKYDQSQALSCYWPLDSNSNDNINSMNGTDTNITYSSGKFGNCAVFNGSSSKIVLTDNSLLKPTGAFTLGMWFKTSSTGSYKTIFQTSSGNTNKAGIWCGISDKNTINVAIANNTIAFYNTSLKGISNVCDNNYHYLVVTYNNNYVQIYVDGKLENASYSVAPVYATTNYVRIGCENSAGSDITFMNGSIDDIYLINGYALDEKTIRDKYNLGTAQGTDNITVTKMAFVSANPTSNSLTLYHGNDYALSNSTITNVYYSNIKCPYGFNIDSEKWRKTYINNTTNQQNSPTGGVWYNVGSITTNIDPGKWKLKPMITCQNGNSESSSIPRVINATISTTTNSNVYSMGIAGATINSYIRTSGQFEINGTFTVKTPIYVLAMSDTTVDVIYINNCRIDAECGYL